MKRRAGGAVMAGVLALLTLAGTAAAQPVTSPSGAQIVRLPGMQPAPLTAVGARDLGPAPASRPESLTVFLASPQQAQLSALAKAVSSPTSPEYRRFLSVAQFRSEFAPPPATVASVNRYLRGEGLSVGSLAPNGLSERVSGAVTKIDAALHLTLRQVATRSGSVVVGATQTPGLPASVASSVLFVDGLAPWIRPHDNLAVSPKALSELSPRSSGVRAQSVTAQQVSECSQLQSIGASSTPTAMDPSDISSADKLDGFYSGGSQGQNQTVGLIEYDSFDTAAVSAWDSCLGINPTIDVEIDPGYAPPATPATLEATSDIQSIVSLSPAATVAVYEANNGTAPPLDPWIEAITGQNSNAPLPSVISSSWGQCEPQAASSSPSDFFSAESSLFQEAAIQGQTIFVASGDQGSEACYQSQSPSPNTALYVNDPASNPFVTAVGGTGSDTVDGPQYVWNGATSSSSNCLDQGCFDGASGGGLSEIWSQPPYQPPDPTLQVGCTAVSGGCREVPDVSALAGNPLAAICSGGVGGCPGTGAAEYYYGIGGTSLAAPQWAATAALADVGCGTNVGFLDPTLYQDTTAGQPVVGAVTSGNNDFTGTNAGLYPAYPDGSQNLATGLGYLGGVDLSGGALCQARGVPPPAPGPYTPLTPTRICDTRPNNPSQLTGLAAQCNGLTPQTGRTMSFSVGGDFGVPADASAVVLNVTALKPIAGGYLTVYPAGAARPTASNVNYSAGQVVPNLVEVGLGTLGRVSVFSFVTGDVVVDLEGYVSPTAGGGAGAGLYNPLPTPTRVCDTRPNTYLTGTAAQCTGKTVATGGTLPVQVTGSFDGVPSGATAVVLNVTAVDPVASGYLTVFPDGTTRPTASNVNYVAGQLVPNRVIVPVGSDGEIDVYSFVSSDVLVDVSGWYTPSSPLPTGAQFNAEPAPLRICDTRPNNPSHLSGLAAQCDNQPLGTGSTLTVTAAASSFGVPSTAKAVVVNVTAIAPTFTTYLTVYPGGARPTTSDLNPEQGSAEANMVVATLSPSGTFTVFNFTGSVNVVVDIAGWYQ